MRHIKTIDELLMVRDFDLRQGQVNRKKDDGKAVKVKKKNIPVCNGSDTIDLKMLRLFMANLSWIYRCFS